MDVHKVQILDPATGTGTFLYGVIDHIRNGFKDDRGMVKLRVATSIA